MSYGVALTFDDAAAAVVHGIWQEVADASDNSAMLRAGAVPHVSLGGCDDPDESAFAPALAAFAKTLQPITLTFDSIGAFITTRAVLFLAPVVTTSLLKVHSGFHATLAGYAHAPIEYYLPGRWVPHCTIGIDLAPAELGAAVASMTRCKLPIRAPVRWLELMSSRSGGPPWAITRYPLG